MIIWCVLSLWWSICNVNWNLVQRIPLLSLWTFCSTDCLGTLSVYTKGILNHLCFITWTNKNKLTSVLTGSYPATCLVPPRFLAWKTMCRLPVQLTDQSPLKYINHGWAVRSSSLICTLDTQHELLKPIQTGDLSSSTRYLTIHIFLKYI